MKNKGRVLLVFLFWLAFLCGTVMIVYVSFQNGEESAQLGKRVMEKIAVEYYGKQELSYSEMSSFIYKVRQLLRIVAFMGLGILGAAAVHFSFQRLSWFTRTTISGCMLVLLSWGTEKGKIYFPTRHYSSYQMMLSIFAAMIGVLLVSVLTLIGSLVRGLHRR